MAQNKPNMTSIGTRAGRFQRGIQAARCFIVSKSFLCVGIGRWANFPGRFSKSNINVAFLLIPVLIGLAISRISAAVTTVGPEASVPLPSSAFYHLELGNQPDDNSVQNFNPPVFSWLYYESPNLFVGGAYQGTRLFTLQLAANTSFSPLIWNITCTNNFYNFLPAITNSDGSTFTNPVYWRVVYMDWSGNVLSNGAPHTFTLSPNALNWDRSMLANDSYLISACASHPHLFFNTTNRDAVSQFVQTTVWKSGSLADWKSVTNSAFNLITNSWWNTGNLTNLNDWFQYSGFFAQVAFTYQMTTNATIAAANPGQMLEIYATNLVHYGYDRIEAYSLNANVPQYLAMSYDWLYPLMTPQQRSNVLYAMESMAQYYVYEDWLYTGTAPNKNRIYTNTLSVKFGSHFREGESHSRNDQVGLALCMAGMGESPVLRGLFNFYMGYYYAQFDPFQGDDGRAYNTAQNFQVTRQFGPALMCADSFPSWGLTNAPIYRQIANIFQYMEPVGYGRTSELEPYCWGVAGGAPLTWLGQWQFSRFYDVACFLNSGSVLRQYNRITAYTRVAGEEPLLEVFNPFYYPPPLEADAPSSAFIDPVRGWAISGSAPPTDWGAFTNGVGFILQARPSAAGRMNATYTDGQLEIWAYGTHVTTGGSGNYEEHCMFQNNPLFVDGIGLNNPNPAVSDPVYARITAFTNCPDFTYASTDLTLAFARTNWTTAGYQDIETKFYGYPTNARPYISSVTRSVLFPHKKYIVMYDRLQTTQPAQFQWKWNVWQPTVTVNPTNFSFNNLSFSYTCTNGLNGSNVTVYVAQIVNSNLLSVTNMTTGSNMYGTNALNTAKINPFTGENYNLPGQDVYYPDHYWTYWADSFWVENQTATNNWHFLTVIYPVNWNQAAPTITRVDDNTVQVQDGSGQDNDTISFNSTNQAPTLNLSGPSLGPVHIAPPSNMRTNGP